MELGCPSFGLSDFRYPTELYILALELLFWYMAFSGTQAENSAGCSLTVNCASDPMLLHDPLDHFLVTGSPSEHISAALPITCGRPMPESTTMSFLFPLLL